MSNLSLLVDCKKIIQWLEDRKKLTKDWYNYVKAAEEKIKVLIKEKDEFSHYPELVEIINKNQENFCFEDVNNFVDSLLKTDLAKEKSLLFGYGDKRVKEWVNLRKFMQSKNIGLLSNAKFIEQGLKFDLPGLDKNIEMMDSQLGMLKRKIDFNKNTIYQQQVEMGREIANVGLERRGKEGFRGFNIESQIPLIIGKVPETMREIEQMFRTYEIQKLLNIYKQRTQRQGLQIQMPMLQYFIAYGNDYSDVYKGLTRRELYSNQYKYREFTHWQPVNEWGIEIQIDDNLNHVNSREGNYEIEQVKINYVTIIEEREMRQELLYNLNELMYFFIGLKTELLNNSKRLDTEHSTTLTQTQLTATISNIRHIIIILNSKLLLTPLELKNNKQSYQYFITKFHNIEKNIQTLQNQINDYQLQIETLNRQRAQQVGRLTTLRDKLVNVKKQQEKLLTQLVTKEVKIVGQINKLE